MNKTKLSRAVYLNQEINKIEKQLSFMKTGLRNTIITKNKYFMRYDTPYSIEKIEMDDSMIYHLIQVLENKLDEYKKEYNNL